jgi:hypothetical protein
MKNKKQLQKSIEIIYQLFEFEIKNILKFYENNKSIKEKEVIINNFISKKEWSSKNINWYFFIKDRTLDIESLFINKQIYLLGNEFVFINRINYWNAVAILAIFEKYIPNLIYEVIYYDEEIIKNSKNDINIKLKPKDIFFLTKELKWDTDINRILILELASEIVKDMLNSKTNIFTKLARLFDISVEKDDTLFKNFITARNIICHLDWKAEFWFLGDITNREIKWYTLYLRSEEIERIIDHILEKMKEINQKILEKYKLKNTPAVIPEITK